MNAFSLPARSVVFLALLSTPFFGTTGCQSSGVRQATAASETAATTAEDLEAARNHIDAAMVALDRMVNRPNTDLRPVFSDYRSAVNSLERDIASLERQSTEIAQRRQDYIQLWQEQNAAIASDAIRARSEARQQEVNTQLADLQNSYQEAREDLIPLLNTLRDIERMLSVDLTVAGIENARSVFGQTDRNARQAREAIAQLTQNFRAASTLLDPNTTTIAE